MKKYIVILVAFLGIMACKKSGSEPDNAESQLPAETSIGANTFGALVDDKVFVANSISGTLIKSKYYSVINIEGVDLISKQHVGLRLPVDSLNFKAGLNTWHGYEFAYYQKQNGIETLLYRYYYGYKGEVYFTKVDTINKIVSGTFSFTVGYLPLQSSYPSDSVSVSKGRFDVHYITRQE
jgi:hypothetical protein